MSKEARISNTIARAPNLMVAVAATLLFAVFKHGAHFSVIADDFVYVNQVVSHQFHLWSFDFFARRPLSTLITYSLYLSRAPEFSQIQFYIAFFANAFALSSLIGYLKKPNTISHFALITAFCLYPSFHEVLFMNLTLSWALGAVYWALTLRTHNKTLQILGTACAAASLETYVLPMLVMPFLKEGREDVKTRSLTTIAGLLTFFVVKTVLSHFWPHLPYAVVFDIAKLWDQIRNCFQFTWLIHFYKTYWLESILQLFAFLLISIFARRNRLLLLVPFLTTVPMWLLAYYAPRSVHASVLLNLALFASYALTLQNVKIQRAVAALIFLAYGIQLVIVANLKEANSEALHAHEIAIVERLKSCPSPCEIPRVDITSGFHGDWVMPDFAYQVYIEWVAHSHGFTQDLTVGKETTP